MIITAGYVVALMLLMQGPPPAPKVTHSCDQVIFTARGWVHNPDCDPNCHAEICIDEPEQKPDMGTVVLQELPRTSWFDGCNTTTCIGDQCSSTLAYCPSEPIRLPVITPGPQFPDHNEPKPAAPDVPAQMVKVLVHHKGDSWECGMMMGCIASEDEYEDRPSCEFDPDRIIHGPNGRGKYFCYKPQTEAPR